MQMKINYLGFLFLALSLIVPAQSFAGGASCTSTTGLVPDGRVLDFDNVQPGSTAYYSFASVAGRSYSIEVRDDLDSNPGSDLQMQYFSQAAQPGNWNCTNGSAMTAGTAPSYTSTQYRDTTAIEPKLVSGQRVSLPAPATDTIVIAVTNSGTNAHYVLLSVSETTLYSPQVNTYGQLNTWYDLNNSTAAPLAYTLTLVASTCAPVPPATTCTNQTVTETNTIPANTTIIRGTSPPGGPISMNVNQFGNATLTHDGPPDALQPQAFLANMGSLPYTFLTVPFGPRGHK